MIALLALFQSQFEWRDSTRTLQTGLTPFLALLQERQAPFSRTLAVLRRSFIIRVLGGRISASDWESSEVCRRFLDFGFCVVFKCVSEVESGEAEEGAGVLLLVVSSGGADQKSLHGGQTSVDSRIRGPNN
jgi:hypothetical protein